MALKTTDVKAAAQAAKETQDSAPEVAAGQKEILLYLALYNVYNRHGVKYEKRTATGQLNVYKFTPKQAATLLAEEDNGRAIWKVYRPENFRKPIEKPKPKPIDVETPVLHDATAVAVRETEQPDPSIVTKRIDIGNDEEIESIISTGDVVEI